MFEILPQPMMPNPISSMILLRYGGQKVEDRGLCRPRKREPRAFLKGKCYAPESSVGFRFRRNDGCHSQESSRAPAFGIDADISKLQTAPLSLHGPRDRRLREAPRLSFLLRPRFVVLDSLESLD